MCNPKKATNGLRERGEFPTFFSTLCYPLSPLPPYPLSRRKRGRGLWKEGRELWKRGSWLWKKGKAIEEKGKQT